MSAATRSEIRVPAPLVHQVAMDESPARFKVCRAGRRFGKTVFAFKAAMVGHGPIGADGEPALPGLAQGWDIVWVARDYTQAGIVWREEIVPRFEDVDGVRLNHTEHTVAIEGHGSLFIRSAENIASIRGIGKRLKGVICEEAAWFDLGKAWRDVLRPALMDNEGWAVFISTTNGGQDGNTDKVAPSFFNRLCLEIMAGQRDREWAHFHGTARDNPKIKAEEFLALKAEYPAGSVSAAQEVEAELVQGGAGLAFPEWSSDVHVVGWDVPREWSWFGGFDWGYESPGCFLLFRGSPDEPVLVRDELYFRHRTAFEVGEDMAALLERYDFEEQFPVFADPSAFNPLDGRPTFAQDVQSGLVHRLGGRAPILMPASQVRNDGKGPRASGKLLVHEALRWTAPDGWNKPLAQLPVHCQPTLVVHRACANLIRTLPALPKSERNPEDVDTDAEDHAYDAMRYALQSRAPKGERPARKREQHRHPGLPALLAREGKGPAPVKPRFRTVWAGRES